MSPSTTRPAKRFLIALATLALFAGACSDDTVDQATVDSVVDDITSDAPEDPPEEPVDPPAAADDAPADDGDPPEESDETPTELGVSSACLLLRHYSSASWPEYPYFASLIVNITTAGGGIIVTHDMVNEAFFTASADGGAAGFVVDWPVEAPGPVSLPSSIKVDGVELIDTVVNDHLEGQDSFVAAASEFTDEWIVPAPCGFDVSIPDGNTLG